VMVKDIKKVLLAFLAGLIVFYSALSAQNNFEKLKSISIEDYSEEKVSVIIDITGPANYYLFRISNPPRLVAEFTSTLVGIEKKDITLKNSLIKKIRIGQYKDIPVKISRIVFDLTAGNIFYDTLAIGNRVYLTVATTSELAKVSIPEPKPRETLRKRSSAAKTSIARNIPPPEHRKKVEEIKSAVAEKEESKPPEEAEVFVPEVKIEGGSLQISKRRISLNFHEADIRMVLKAIAEQTEINFIYGSDVEGTITLKLKDVTFDDAMRLILKLSGLVVVKEADNIVRIITPEELKSESSEAVQFTRVVPLKYTCAEDIKKQLTAVTIEGLTAVIGEDSLTNSIILTASPQGLERYRELVSIFDVKPRQVLIEASLLEVDYSEGFDLGIAWGLSNFNVYKKGDGSSDLLTGSIDSMKGKTIGTLGTPALTFTIGGLLNANQFNATINALQKRNKTKLLSKPKIVALNTEEAKIVSSEALPYTTTVVDPNGIITTSINFTEVGIELTVTPTIHSEEYVTLKVKPRVTTLRQQTAAGPWTAMREATTKVMVKSGETVVIGGLIKEEDLKAVEQFPLLGDLPILGYLFKHQQETKDRVELLIFLKPTILE